MKTEQPAVDLKSVSKAVSCLLETKARKVTLYQHPKLTVAATRRFKPDARNLRTEILLTIGRPNYQQRKFISACVKAGEPFPVRKPQLSLYPRP